jgi:hypothetical protein
VKEILSSVATGCSPGSIACTSTESNRIEQKTILYRIALAQPRGPEQARASLGRRCAERKSSCEAVRALKRHLIHAEWRLWQNDPAQQEQDRLLAAAQGEEDTKK